MHRHELYPGIIQKVWMERMSGPAVESLRRCVDAFQEEGPKRLTPEFDALIQLDPEPISKATADAILAEPTGRQWIGVYVDNEADANRLVAALDLLKHGRLEVPAGSRKGNPAVAIPSLDWDDFESSSPEDEAWRSGHVGGG